MSCCIMAAEPLVLKVLQVAPLLRASHQQQQHTKNIQKHPKH